jgi:hypothetical protein
MKWVLTIVCALLASQTALAEDAKASEDSVRQLLQVMQSSRIIDTYMTQIENTVRMSLQEAVAGQPVNAKQQKVMDDLQHKILATARDEINWTSVEPMMVAAYRGTFTQHEVDGMLAFYRSEPGQAVLTKLPGAMQRTMEGMQGRVKTLTPKIVELEKDAAVQVKAAAGPPGPLASPVPPPPPGAPPKRP